MIKQITSFAAHFCSWTHKHDFWCDTKEMFQAHADLKRANPLAWSNKLFTFILEIDKSLLDFFMTWNRFGCVTLVTKPGSYGLKWTIGTTPPLRRTKNKILWGATKNLKICIILYKTVKEMIKEKLGMCIVLYFFNEHPTLNPQRKTEVPKRSIIFSLAHSTREFTNLPDCQWEWNWLITTKRLPKDWVF